MSGQPEELAWHQGDGHPAGHSPGGGSHPLPPQRRQNHSGNSSSSSV